ncbi:hypothetical protein LSAT2_011250 [Lamellibrachia satsuma]|nr:hypothetical protein LSAT2_011250 [Lamellibrachia satsuma]
MQPISLEVRRRRWKWIRHVCRIPLTSIPRVAMRWTPGGKRVRGRPKETWRRSVEREMKALGWSWGQERIQSFSDIIHNNMQRRTVFGDSDSEEDVEELGMGAEVDEEADNGADSAKGDYLLIESDSDDAPEDVGFVRSRESALQHVKEVMQQIGKTEQQKKEKRKHLDEKFKEQKKKKLERLQLSRLPDDVLEEVANRPRLMTSAVPEEKKESPTENESVASVSGESDKEVTDDEDYISINKDPGIHAVCFQDVLKLKQGYVQEVASFREQHLYGRRIARQSIKEKRLQSAKRTGAKNRSKRRT